MTRGVPACYSHNQHFKYDRAGLAGPAWASPMARLARLTWSARCHHSARRPTWFHPSRAGPDSAAATARMGLPVLHQTRRRLLPIRRHSLHHPRWQAGPDPDDARTRPEFHPACRMRSTRPMQDCRGRQQPAPASMARIRGPESSGKHIVGPVGPASGPPAERAGIVDPSSTRERATRRGGGRTGQAPRSGQPKMGPLRQPG